MEDLEEEFFVSFVYGFNLVADRKPLWEDLKNHHDSPIFSNKPWMSYGDFNEILKAEEHSCYDTGPSIPVGMRDFQEVVSYCSLSDMQSHGPFFTWCNKRDDAALICKKLDRVLVNDSWLTEFAQSYSVFEAGGCSDHLRCRIQIGVEKQHTRKPFKFTNALVSDANFLPLVQAHWDITEPLFHSTTATYRFSKKLKTLKPAIKNLSKSRLRDLSKQTKAAFDRLCKLQLEVFLNPVGLAMRTESVAYHKWMHLSGLEERFLKQRSKLHWLKVGDGNNKVFHRAVKIRQARNAMKEILRLDGVIVDSQEEMKAEAERYFHEFLTHKPSYFTGSLGHHRASVSFHYSNIPFFQKTENSKAGNQKSE
ncbi:PREDICTED: uncharacterized protein LOC109127347 [Camelina sativa]|uniref:Uncharacterized protein LOC109127347 n=1 Tax=Camelina sativa TaxID=90675 RepID=A0ABM1QL60_CAMSA|nr:PREDICTED: uncharacterized protein LOC109127347 [Camelina sativa]